MRRIRELISADKKVYILLPNKTIQYRFISDAAYEGIAYSDGVPATERPVDDIMSLRSDGTICFLGWAGRMYYHHFSDKTVKVDYEKYINDQPEYIVK
jgi:hypothetical protein